MLYLSARQMWHDCYYTRSANDAALELQKSNVNILRRKQAMNETQTRGPADNGKKVMHQVMAGKVQSRIARLPEYLQAFGNYCWAPKAIDNSPSFKDQHKHMGFMVGIIKSAYPDLYAQHTSAVSIVIMQTFKYEYDRAKGRKPQSLDIMISSALAQPKEKVRSKWGEVIKLVRNGIRTLNLDADNDRNLDIATEALLSQYFTNLDEKFTKNGKKTDSGGKEFTNRYQVLARLAIKLFAHKDQAYLFSAGEIKESVQYRAPLYTQEYLSWCVGVQQANWWRDGWQDAFNAMMGICDEWAREALQRVD